MLLLLKIKKIRDIYINVYVNVRHFSTKKIKAEYVSQQKWKSDTQNTTENMKIYLSYDLNYV